jgi:hypothetical protein
LLFQTSAQRSYTKTYFKNGQLQAEGWLIINQWITGFIIMKMEIKKEGHYEQ